MPSPERAPYTLAELAELYRAAQERLGLYSSLRSLDEWGGVNLVNPSTSGSWFTNLFGSVRLLRRLSRMLASRYYNLNRAVGAGRSFSNPDGSDTYERSVPLRRLYDDFGQVLDLIADTTALPATPSSRAPSGPANTPAGAPPAAESPGRPDDSRQERLDALDDRLDAVVDELKQAFDALEHDFSDDAEVPVDPFDWPDPDIEDDFEKEYRDLLDAELDALEKEIKQLEQDEAANAAELRSDIASAGTRTSFTVASITDAASLDPGRTDLVGFGIGDKLVKGWIRITGPHPCAFCAMLASRGTFYLSAESAGKAYHQNCHCNVVPVFEIEPARSARDQWFADKWKAEAKGFPDALNKWRSFLTKAYREGQVPDQDVYGPARPARTRAA